MSPDLTVHTSFRVNFIFTNNITILAGSSASGKTASFSFIRESMALNPDIVCLNYLDYQRDLKEILKRTGGKLIVIDNADILLGEITGLWFGGQKYFGATLPDDCEKKVQLLTLEKADMSAFFVPKKGTAL